MAFGRELFVHLRAKAVHQHHFDAHALDHGQVLHQAGQLARRNGFPRNGHDKSFAAVHVYVGRHRTEPRDEGEIEDSGHGRR